MPDGAWTRRSNAERNANDDCQQKGNADEGQVLCSPVGDLSRARSRIRLNRLVAKIERRGLRIIFRALGLSIQLCHALFVQRVLEPFERRDCLGARSSR